MRETEVKQYARQRGIKLWEIAERVGIAPEIMSKRLRHEFSPEERQKVLEVIDELAASREVNA